MLYFSKWLLWFVKKWNKVRVKKEKRKLHQTHDNPVFNKKGQMCCLDFKFKKKIDWNELSIFSQQNKKSLNTLQMITQRSYHVAILSADQYRRFIGKTFVLLGQHKCGEWWAPSQKAASRATRVQEAFSSFYEVTNYNWVSFVPKDLKQLLGRLFKPFKIIICSTLYLVCCVLLVTCPGCTLPLATGILDQLQRWTVNYFNSY